MKLIDINKSSIKKITNKELVRIHIRIHQLYGVSKKRKINLKFLIFLKNVHILIVDEMTRRGIKHKSVLENYILSLFNK